MCLHGYFQFTYAKLDGNGEEVGSSSLSDGITTGDTGKINEAGLNNTLLSLGSLDHLLGESTNRQLKLVGIDDVYRPVTSIGHGEGS